MYNQDILDAYHHPAHLRENSGQQHINASCGDWVRVELQLNDKQITDIVWHGEGCVISQAATDLVIDHILTQKLSAPDIRNLSTATLLDVLELPNLSLGRYKCASLGLTAIQAELERSL